MRLIKSTQCFFFFFHCIEGLGVRWGRLWKPAALLGAAALLGIVSELLDLAPSPAYPRYQDLSGILWRPVLWLSSIASAPRESSQSSLLNARNLPPPNIWSLATPLAPHLAARHPPPTSAPCSAARHSAWGHTY